MSASQPLVPQVLGSVAPVATAGTSLPAIATAPSASPASGNDSLPIARHASPYSALSSAPPHSPSARPVRSAPSLLLMFGGGSTRMESQAGCQRIALIPHDVYETGSALADLSWA